MRNQHEHSSDPRFLANQRDYEANLQMVHDLCKAEREQSQRQQERKDRGSKKLYRLH